ncbi:MAG: hypothetical protein GX552_08040 [Chloroflexi bacterium]|jgi:hypothetical protein|nr:hypothetical protein [Chloroflexota bacterium]
MSQQGKEVPATLPQLNASEIGRYAYCARAWWLQRVKGHAPDNIQALTRGTARHEQHGRLVASAHRRIAWARALLLVALGVIAILALAWLRSALVS